jgi:hypothetical protein
MKPGTKFLHARWLDTNNQPLLCIVTKVANGIVYWKQEGERKAKSCFGTDEIVKYVKKVI